jgi:acetyl-CoA carboxylase carboxyltransferase component
LEDIIKKLKDIKQRILQGGSEEKTTKIHASGKLTARERIGLLLDPGTFYELNPLVGLEIGAPGDGIIIGYGEIDGRTVCVYSQDTSVLGGSIGYLHGSKLYGIIERAFRMGCPIVGLNDTPGARVQRRDSPDANILGMTDEKHGASVFMINTIASGVIPQISAILGSCAGIGVYSPALMDFIFIVEGIGQMFITGPRVIKSVMGEEIDSEDLGGAKVHCRISGVADLRVRSEVECMQKIRRLLSFLPSNCNEKPPLYKTNDDPERPSDALSDIVPANPYKPFDMHKVIEEIVDDRDFFEIKPEFAGEVIVGFGRLNGRTIGVVANQPMVRAGCLTVDSSDKQARFIRFCDAFNIPIVLLIDTPAYLPGKVQEHAGIIRHGAKVLYALCEAVVPKVAIIIRKVYGGGTLGMGVLPGLGTDLIFAWPIAEMGIMGAEPSVNLLFGKEIKQADNPDAYKAEKIKEYREQYANPIAISSRCTQIHDVIEPSNTRSCIIKSLKFLEGKKIDRAYKRHGNIPL